MSQFFSKAVPFARRVLAHEATRRGLMSAAAGVLVGVVSEAVFPSS